MRRTPHGMTVLLIDNLLESIRERDVDHVKELIAADETLIISSNHDGISALHVAAWSSDVDMVRLLLNKGANVNARTSDGSTPLSDACAVGSVEVTRLLLEHGAAVNFPLLLQLSTPLHEASIYGNVACCELLLARGANIGTSDGNYGTPLHAACYHRYYDVVLLLLKHGADANATKIHVTPLHIAALRDCLEIVMLLVFFGANPSLRDNRNRRPYDLTTSDSIKSFLCATECYPQSLQQCCRLALKRMPVTTIEELDFPNSLKLFLMYKNLVVTH